MAKHNEVEQIQNEVAKVIPEGGISTEALLQILAKMNSESSERLANAIIEARKPYIDPKQEANDEMFKEQNRRQMAQEREAKRRHQSTCPHIAGCNPLSELRDPAGRTSIVWHKSDSTEVFGVCTNCTRIFRETDDDYVTWRQKPSFNRISMAGDHGFTDVNRAKELARS